MINNIFLIFRSILFWINLVLSVLFFGPVAFTLGLFSYEYCLKISKTWCKCNLYFLKYFCSLSYKIRGSDLNSSQLIVSKHQSAWETIFLAAYVDKPIFILKKELLMIPLFGWCLYLLKNISINRSEGVRSLKKILDSCGGHIEKKRTLIVFPEGTRVPYGHKVHLKKGIFKIIDSLKISSLVFTHDAGKFWSKNSFIIRPGEVAIYCTSLDYNKDNQVLGKKIVECFEQS
tara:strand:+ start:143 stop:835 length:693 start_codon:yes stop_codon:yes gene_type:complete